MDSDVKLNARVRFLEIFGKIEIFSKISLLPTHGNIPYFSTAQRRSRRRPDGQEMRNISKLQPSVTCIPVNSSRYSDDESDLPPTKRARDNTIISDYEDMWAPSLHDDRPIILTPPSLVSPNSLLAII